jgi:hypothetical protein
MTEETLGEGKSQGARSPVPRLSGTSAGPNNGLELTASSVRSYLAPASSGSSGLALAVRKRRYLHDEAGGVVS